MPPITIIIDTREQRAWGFPPELATCRRDTLPAGDYALDGDPQFAIERKSLDDFAGTVSSGWERFQRELTRMRELGFPALVVVVEAAWSDVLDHRHNHPQVTPQFLLKRVAELTMAGVSVLFAGDEVAAAGMAVAILRERERTLRVM